MMGGKRILSDDQLITMAEMRERGRSYQAIALYFSNRGTPIHEKTIRWQCLNVGAYPPGHRPANLGIKTPGSKGRAFTPDEDRQLIDLEAKGLSKAEIGRRLNRPPNSITGRLMTLAMHDAVLEAA